MITMIKICQIWHTKTVIILSQCCNASMDIDCRQNRPPSFYGRPLRIYLDLWQTPKVEPFCWKLHLRCLIKCSIHLNMLKVFLHNFCVYLYVMVTDEQKYSTYFFWFILWNRGASLLQDGLLPMTFLFHFC